MVATKKQCSGTTVSGKPCRRTGKTDKDKYLCPIHSGKTMKISEDVCVCFASTKSGAPCRNRGKGGREIYNVNFPAGVYLCPLHYKTLLKDHPKDIETYLEGMISEEKKKSSKVPDEKKRKIKIVEKETPKLPGDKVFDDSLFTSSSSDDEREDDIYTFSSSSDDKKEEEAYTFSTEEEIETPSLASSKPSLKKKKPSPTKKKPRIRKHPFLPPVVKTQPSVQCIGWVTKYKQKVRCANKGQTDGVFRCRFHPNDGKDYRRCKGTTKDGFHCVRVGIPKNGAKTFWCHQHSK